MRIRPAIALLALQIGLATTLGPLHAAQNPATQAKSTTHAAAQNPLAGLEEAAKEKAAEEALTKVLNDNLPLTLNAKDVYPTVATLPGGPFSPTPLQLTADELNQPLAPGDYTINTLDFCSEYSVHQPGAGLAYVLGPYEGKAAGAIGALIWRGTEQYGIAPQSLQAVSWAIQSGLTYDQMPKSYQAIIDQVIPDLKSQITSDLVTNLENTYNSLAKSAKLPPLDTMLAKLGAPGQLALDAERQRQILTAQNTSDELKQQTLFQGQESGVYTPVKAENGPWTERVKGQVYMKLLIAGGNMNSNNVLQIRVMPTPATTATNAAHSPHLVRTAYGEPQVTAAAANTPITIASIVQGILGYAQGQGAQALGQVVAVLKALNPLQVTPAEAETLPPASLSAPASTPPATVTAQTTPPPATQPTVAPANAGATNNTAQNTEGSNFKFASCSGTITSQQLSTAYQSLYLGSATFKARMDQITNPVSVLMVDGCSAQGRSYQRKATNGYIMMYNNHFQGGGYNDNYFPPSGDYAYTYMPIDPKTKQVTGEIAVVITAQHLEYDVYDAGYNDAPGFTEGACGATANPVRFPVWLQQTLAYELAQNAIGYHNTPGYQTSGKQLIPLYEEVPDQGDTNTIMGELQNSYKIKFENDVMKDAASTPNPADPSKPGPAKCVIMSADSYCSDQRKCAIAGSIVNCKGDAYCPGASAGQGTSGQGTADQIKGEIWNFGQPREIVGTPIDPPVADVYDGTGQLVGSGQQMCTPSPKQALTPPCPTQITPKVNQQ